MSKYSKPEIIFEDDDLVVINKPSGMLSIPDRIQSEPSLKDILIARYGNIFTVHRLDKDTSGVILFAKNEAAHKFLSLQFENRETAKFYVGLVNGHPSPKSGVIDVPIVEHPAKNGSMITARKGKESITEYEVLEEVGAYSLVQFRILTGRTHQIRVHMKHLGHPIVCDPLYGDGKPILVSAIKKKFKLAKDVEEERPILGRLALHAQKLIIQKIDGSQLELEAEMPKDMRATLQQLHKSKKH